MIITNIFVTFENNPKNIELHTCLGQATLRLVYRVEHNGINIYFDNIQLRKIQIIFGLHDLGSNTSKDFCLKV